MKVAARQTLRPSTHQTTRYPTRSTRDNIKTNNKDKLTSNRRQNEKNSFSQIRKNMIGWNQDYLQSSSSLIQDPYLNSLRKHYLSQVQDSDLDFSMIETTILENFQRHIREYKQSCALKNNYEEAQATLRLSKFVFKEIQKRNFSNYYSSSVGKRYQTPNTNNGRGSTTNCNKRPNLSPLLNQNQDQNQTKIENQAYLEDSFKNNKKTDSSIDCDMDINYLDRTNETIEQFKARTEEKRSKLIVLHKQQLEQFENIWNTEMPKKYRKPSARLLEIKKREHSLALTRNYEEAKKLHKFADELIQQENKDAQNRLNNDYKAARKQLLERFEKELENFETTRKGKLNLLLVKSQERKETEEKREHVITAQQISNQRLFKDLFNISNNIQDEVKSFPAEDNESKIPRPTTASMLVMALNSNKSDNINYTYSRNPMNSPSINGRKNLNDDYLSRTSINTPSSNKRPKFIEFSRALTSLNTPCGKQNQINKSLSAPKSNVNSPKKPNSNYSKASPKIVINFDNSSSESDVEDGKEINNFNNSNTQENDNKTITFNTIDDTSKIKNNDKIETNNYNNIDSDDNNDNNNVDNDDNNNKNNNINNENNTANDNVDNINNNKNINNNIENQNRNNNINDNNFMSQSSKNNQSINPDTSQTKPDQYKKDSSNELNSINSNNQAINQLKSTPNQQKYEETNLFILDYIESVKNKKLNISIESAIQTQPIKLDKEDTKKMIKKKKKEEGKGGKCLLI